MTIQPQTTESQSYPEQLSNVEQGGWTYDAIQRGGLRRFIAAVPQLITRALRGKIARVFLVRTSGVATLFGFEIILARQLGLDGYGAFSFALAVATIVARLAPLGWPGLITRLVSTYISAVSHGLLKGGLILAHVATGLGLTIFALLGLAILSTGSPAVDPMLFLILPLVLMLAFLELHRHVLRGQHAGELGEALLVLLLPGCAAATLWIFHIRDASTAIYAYTAACLVPLVISSIVIARRLPEQIWASAAEFRIREWSLGALALLLAGASEEFATRTAVIVLGSLGTVNEAGLYQAAFRLALMNVFVLRALTPIAAPRISVLYHQGHFNKLRSTFRQWCVLSVLGCLPSAFIFLFFAESVLRWFGPEFIEVGPILRTLSVGFVASAAAGPCATALIMIGRERIYAVLAFCGFLVTVVGTYVLAQFLGALGAAVAMAGVMVISNVTYVTIFFQAIASAEALSQETDRV